MATQSTTARQAAGQKAAATRKRNAAKRSATGTKASARQTTGAARSTAKQSARTAGRSAGAANSSLKALTRQAERSLVLIPVGAALEARDAVLSTVRIYADRRSARRELDRLERRGEQAIRRNRRRLEREVRSDIDQIRSLV
jgi:hypothetical protein